MTPERWRRARDLFDQALELTPPDREPFLEQATAGDGEMRAEVERLLAADQDLQQRPRFERPSGPASDETRTSAGGHIVGAGETIAGYRILGRLGSGGMGVVYRAEQQRPRRQVALKLVRSDCVSPENLRRFSVEVEVLGRLAHPHIAAIYDAGLHVDSDGQQQPYIAMELVDGRPLLDFIDATQPPLTRRIELLARMCDGIQHAHQNGIVHRDLKPGNILIDAAGQPKIVDFGIARPLYGELAVTLPETTPGEFIGTLAYMSPERLHGSAAPIDTRADVYSLGVVAYQTISGRMHLNLRGVAIAEVIRRIRDDAPQPLTSRDKPADIDLQAVVRKALERDPADRYASAAALADDLRRYLAGEPVTARPPTLWRHARSFVRRHRVATAAVAAVVIVSIAAAITSTTFAIAAHRARRAAQSESDKRTAVNDFLLGEMFDWGDPEYAAGRHVTVLEVIDRAAERIESIENPDIRAEVLYALSVIYRAQGAAPRGAAEDRPTAKQLALRFARAALGIWRETRLPNDLDIARGWDNLARCLSDSGDNAAARDSGEAALGIRLAVSGEADPLTLQTRLLLATNSYLREDLEHATEQIDRVLHAVDRTGEPRIFADALYLRAQVFDVGGRFDQAEDEYTQALQVCHERLPNAYALQAAVLRRMAELAGKRGDFGRNRRLLAESEEICERIYPPNHPVYGTISLSRASLYLREGDLEQARAAAKRAVAIYEPAYRGAPHIFVARAYHWLALVEQKRGDCAAALEAVDRAIEIYRATEGESSTSLSRAWTLRAECLDALGSADD